MKRGGKGKKDLASGMTLGMTRSDLLVWETVDVGVSDAPLTIGRRLEVGQGLNATVDAGLAHLLKADGGNETGRTPGGVDLAVEFVDLFERETLGLVDHEPDEGATDEAEATPDEEDLDAQVGVALTGTANEVRGGVGDGPVEEPVGRRGHGERLGPDLEGEELAGDDPGDGAPGTGEEEDVEADEGDDDLVGDLGLGGDADDGDDELTDAHADGAEEQQRPATPLLDEVQAGEGGEDVDDAGDHGGGEGVLDARVLKKFGAVIEDEVDPGQLLEGLEAAAGGQALAEVAPEAIEVGGLAQTQLVLMVGLDLGQLLDEGGMADVETAQARHGSGGLLGLAPLDQISGRLGQDDHADDEDDGPGELDGDGDPVGASVVPVLGGVVDDGGQQQTDGDGQLIGTDDGATDPLG